MVRVAIHVRFSVQGCGLPKRTHKKQISKKGTRLIQNSPNKLKIIRTQRSQGKTTEDRTGDTT